MAIVIPDGFLDATRDGRGPFAGLCPRVRLQCRGHDSSPVSSRWVRRTSYLAASGGAPVRERTNDARPRRAGFHSRTTAGRKEMEARREAGERLETTPSSSAAMIQIKPFGPEAPGRHCLVWIVKRMQEPRSASRKHGVALSIPWRRVADGLLAAGVGLLARLGSMPRFPLTPANHEARSLATVNTVWGSLLKARKDPVKTAGPGGRRWDG